MNPNQHVTPETGKLLEEAGLIDKRDCLFVWQQNISFAERKHEFSIRSASIDGYPNLERYPAPTLGEIWELLPKKIELCISKKEEWYGEAILILNEHEIMYEFQHDEYYRNRSTQILNNNPADAAGRLLLQLHKDGKLDKTT